MTKKQFIALTEYMRDKHPYNSTEKHQRESLAAWCSQQNPRFNRERWLGYIDGKNGKNGGKVKV